MLVQTAVVLRKPDLRKAPPGTDENRRPTNRSRQARMNLRPSR